jgi:hypothetical protein
MTNPTLTIDAPDLDLRASVTFDRWDANHAQYAWCIESISDPTVSAAGTDLRMGSTDGEAEALASLLVFLSAHAEAIAYERRNPDSEPDNLHLFPVALMPLSEVLDGDSLAVLADGLSPQEA